MIEIKQNTLGIEVVYNYLTTEEMPFSSENISLLFAEEDIEKNKSIDEINSEEYIDSLKSDLSDFLNGNKDKYIID
ncbi:hypothetical protein [Lactobacillus taiwanensis]|uniref:hypothetical protein n=1 Tax=Lactobacillus taiwanensis TaxID=508451 RepID=UPI003220680E